jgi:hypothetical protein
MAKDKVPGTTGYNADAKAEERRKQEIVIGGQTFRPRKKTMALLDDWNQVSPQAEDVTAEGRDPLENFRDVYKQVRVFLSDDENQQPEIEFLYENLDLDDAVELLMKLQPTLGGEAEALRDLPREEVATAT